MGLLINICIGGDGSAALGLLSFAADRHPAGQLHTRAARELVQFPWQIRQIKKDHPLGGHF